MLKELSIIIFLALSILAGLTTGVVDIRSNKPNRIKDRGVFVTSIFVSLLFGLIAGIEYNTSMGVITTLSSCSLFFLSHGVTVFIHLSLMLFVPAIKEFFKKIHSHFSV